MAHLDWRVAIITVHSMVSFYCAMLRKEFGFLITLL